LLKNERYVNKFAIILPGCQGICTIYTWFRNLLLGHKNGGPFPRLAIFVFMEFGGIFVSAAADTWIPLEMAGTKRLLFPRSSGAGIGREVSLGADISASFGSS
jgi:hypothetical protein